MKLLIVKIGAIGDALMARGMPLAVPDKSEVSWLCGESVAPLVRQFQGVHEVITLDDKALLAGGTLGGLKALSSAWRKLAGRRFDLVATGHSDGRYRLLSLTASAAERRDFASQRLVPGRLHSDEYARLVHGIDGPDAPRAALPRLRQPRPRAKHALLFPGGAKNLLRDDALRRWPLGHYASLAKSLLQRGWSVDIAGSSGDAWILPAFEGLDLGRRVGGLDLDQTLDACAEAGVVATHDSGPLHLALASSAKVLALFGPTRPGERLRPGPGVSVLWGGDNLACRPCYDGRDYAPCPANRCLSELTPERALEAVEALHAQQ